MPQQITPEGTVEPNPLERFGPAQAEQGVAARRWNGLRATIAAAGAGVLGAAPHVLHHVGPLAGAAILAGAAGKLLFGALGFLLALPMLLRLRRRHGSWLVPGGVLGAMAVIFTLSTFVVGPALTAGDDDPTGKAPTTTAPPGVSDAEHEAHH